MKTLVDINALLGEFEKQFGIKALGATQGSEVWRDIKLGVLSASNASKIVAKKDSETRATYMAELVAQVCTGFMEEVSSKAMEWGAAHEDAARASYEFDSGNGMAQVPFVFKDNNFREGCSPDGLTTATSGVEIKCPFNSVHYIKFIAEERIKPEYVWQNQFTLRVTGAESWDFGQYDPRMKIKPMHFITIGRDEEKQKALDDLVPQFIFDMDRLLAKIGIKFGAQWESKSNG